MGKLQSFESPRPHRFHPRAALFKSKNARLPYSYSVLSAPKLTNAPTEASFLSESHTDNDTDNDDDDDDEDEDEDEDEDDDDDDDGSDNDKVSVVVFVALRWRTAANL